MKDLHLIFLERVDSTNNYALQLIREGKANEGMVIYAENQWAGRGRAEKHWDSAPSKNLTFSVILSPRNLDPSRQFAISQAVSLGIVKYLRSQLGDEPVVIKWPNDIYCGKSKLAGILIENLIFGNYIEYSVLGIGLNLNQTEFSPGIPAPLSLSQLSGSLYEPRAELLKLMASLQTEFELIDQEEFELLRERYCENLYLAGIPSTFMANGVTFRGIIEGVNQIGQLMVRREGGDSEAYNMDELVFLHES